MIVTDNPILTQLDGLVGLQRIGGRLVIANNALLSQVDGLAALGRVGGRFILVDNPALKTLEGLRTLARLEGELVTGDNTLFVPGTINALAGQLEGRGFGGVVVDRTVMIENRADLEALVALGGASFRLTGSLFIMETALEHLDGLQGLHQVDGSVFVIANPQLTRLQGLAGLQRIGCSLIIHSNARLGDLVGLENLEAIGGQLVIGSAIGGIGPWLPWTG
ncbi:MAG: hypothetical protein GKR89_11835 [Candidatus Latescibacteria bacterium]|nr:hypothetical protein [Candidatus Latescibacterota bacterium]